MSCPILPPEILSLIISRILFDGNTPLSQRIRLRRVSKDWQDIIEADLASQTQLVLYGDRDDNPRAQDDLVLSEHHFTAEFVQLITRLFPIIADLSVTTFSKASYQQLPRLLAPYQATLTSLSLSGECYQRTNSYGRAALCPLPATEHLVTALNDLPNLTSLQLSEYRFTVELFQQLAPTLARLVRFVLKHERRSTNKVILGQTIFAALTARCTHLQLPASFLYWWNIRTIPRSLTHLVIDVDEKEHRSMFNRIGQLAAVRHLQVQFYVYSPLNTARFCQLGPLQHITELELLGLTFDETIKSPSNTDHRLNNVRQLTLGLVNSSALNNDAAHHLWSSVIAWFPALERLTIRCRQDSPELKAALRQFPIVSVVNDEAVGQ